MSVVKKVQARTRHGLTAKDLKNKATRKERAYSLKERRKSWASYKVSGRGKHLGL